MHAGNIVHIAGAGVAISSSVTNVLQGTLGVSQGFQVETCIELCVELTVELRATRLEHLLDREVSAKHLVNLAHGNTRIRPDGEKCRLGFGGRFGTRYTKEMPRRVFDIIWIY